MTDVYGDRAVRFIRGNAPARKPFFLWLTPNAPHTETDTGRFEGTPAVPPPRYAKTYANAPVKRPPSFDEADVSDKPQIVGQLFKRIDGAGMERLTANVRGRLGAIRGVDDMVARVVAELRRTGELDNTLVVFTSDNGWLLGEHRIIGQKYFGFEESIRVPLPSAAPASTRGVGSTTSS
jgi:arylsulfatase A-like enzyme